MLLKILGTIFSKIFTAGIGFLVVVITARELGASIRGDIALILLNISIIGLFQGIFNGSSLVYLTPRFSFLKLFFITNLFSLILAIILPYGMMLIYLLPKEQLNDIILLSMIQGLLTTSQSLLLGKEKIHLFNLLEIIKSSVLFIAIIVFFWGMNQVSLNTVILSYLISYIIPFVLSLIPVFSYINNQPKEVKNKNVFTSLLKYGFEIQINNISHMINYRFCFYIIEKWKGKDALGVFSIALSLCEAIWIISKSISTFQYSKIVNSDEPLFHKKLTIQSIQLTFLITLPVLILVLLLPISVFTSVFGNDFHSLKFVLYSLSMGILALSIFSIINHYFSGIGKNKINIIASLLGNIVVVISCLLLIPIWGNIGAGIATSITYLVILLYLVYRFLKQSNTNPKNLIPTKNSVKFLIQELKN